MALVFSGGRSRQQENGLSSLSWSSVISTIFRRQIVTIILTAACTMGLFPLFCQPPSDILLSHAVTRDHYASGSFHSNNDMSSSSLPSTLTSSLPLQVLPLMKELRTGWGNMKVPQILERQAQGTRSLIVDIGLDKGEEFFLAVSRGFEVVGMEPNPGSFQDLSIRCRQVTNCQVIQDVNLLLKTPLSQTRQPGMSYLINAGAGAKQGTLELALTGPLGSFVPSEMHKTAEKANVPVIRIDDIIQEDVFLLKIDTQGFEHYVLQGCQRLFQNHVVRQLIFEFDPYPYQVQGINFTDTLKMVQNYGMLCFGAKSDNPKGCDLLTDSAYQWVAHKHKETQKLNAVDKTMAASKCWDDLLCINIAKSYTGVIPGLRTIPGLRNTRL